MTGHNRSGFFWRCLQCLCCLGVLLVMPAQAEDIRTWVDADGTVHFGDKGVAPKDSKAVELKPSSVVTVTPAPAAAAASAPAVAASPAPSAKRHCTPVMEQYQDQRTGMHSERETGRCAEDGDVVPNYDYPYYYWGPCNGPACMRPPRPDRPLPPRPVQPLPPRGGIGGTPLVPFR